MSKIADLIKQLFNQALDNEEIYLKVGTASEVDLTDYTFTFTPNDESAKIDKCLLKSISTETGGSIIQVPESGSFVLVGFTSNTTGVLLFAEVTDKIIFSTKDLDQNIEETKTSTAKNQNTTIDEVYNVNAGTFNFNGGDLGGLIKITLLTEKLNKLKDEVNVLITNFNAHTHIGVRTGTSVSGIPAGLPTDAATDFSKNDYENTKVNH